MAEKSKDQGCKHSTLLYLIIIYNIYLFIYKNKYYLYQKVIIFIIFIIMKAKYL